MLKQLKVIDKNFTTGEGLSRIERNIYYRKSNMTKLSFSQRVI